MSRLMNMGNGYVYSDEQIGLAADVLEAAADNLFVQGWQQGTYGSEDGKRCAIGHILSGEKKVLNSRFCNIDRLVHVDTIARSALRDQIDSSHSHGISTWNDEEGRTAEEVRDALLGAAKDLRNRIA